MHLKRGQTYLGVNTSQLCAFNGSAQQRSTSKVRLYNYFQRYIIELRQSIELKSHIEYCDLMFFSIPRSAKKGGKMIKFVCKRHRIPWHRVHSTMHTNMSTLYMLFETRI